MCIWHLFVAVNNSSSLFSNGTVVLVDTETWEQTPVCRLRGTGGAWIGLNSCDGVRQLCWVSPVDCLLVGGTDTGGGEVYSLHVPDSGGGLSECQLHCDDNCVPLLM